MKKSKSVIEKLESGYREHVSQWLERQTSKIGCVAGLSQWAKRWDTNESIIARALYTGNPEKSGIKWTIGNTTLTTIKGGVKVAIKGSKPAELKGPQSTKLASALLERPETSYWAFCARGNTPGVKVTRTRPNPIPEFFSKFLDAQRNAFVQGKREAYALKASQGAFKPAPKKSVKGKKH